MAEGRKAIYTFGAGREAYAKCVFPATKNIADKSVPGPGAYENSRIIAVDAKKYTMSPKTIFQDAVSLEKRKDVPGPGQYEAPVTLAANGKYNVSTYL